MSKVLEFPKGGKVAPKKKAEQSFYRPAQPVSPSNRIDQYCEHGNNKSYHAAGKCDAEQTVDARSILEAALESAKDIDSIVLLMTDHNGNLGLVSNLDGTAENLLFLEGAKAKLVASQYELSGIRPTPEPA